MAFFGADPTELRALARELEGRIEVLLRYRQMLHRVSAELPELWVGDDAEQFGSATRSEHLPGIDHTIALVRRGAEALYDEARAQELASAGGL